MWAQRDEFHFAWKRLRGDFILQARVELLGPGVDPHRKLGLIARSSLDAGLGLRRRGGPRRRPHVRCSSGARKGAATEQVALGRRRRRRSCSSSARATRTSLSAARFGEPLTVSAGGGPGAGRRGVRRGSSSARTTRTWSERALFRDVRIIRPAKDGFKPYTDYIGSVLEILDVGDRPTARWCANRPIRSRRPTGRADGSALVYNSSRQRRGRGRIHRFDLADAPVGASSTPASRSRNNNDHVLSFDGTRARDQRPERGRAGSPPSTCCPRRAAMPQRVTPLSAVLPARLVARRHARSSTRAGAQRRVRHLRASRPTAARPR